MFNLLLYPPTVEQLKIMSWMGWYGEGALWLIRLSTLIILTIALWRWGRIIKDYTNQRTALTAVILLVISPTLWVILWLYPLMAVMLLVMTGMFGVKNKWVWLGIIILPLINIWWLSSHPAILNKLSLKDAQTEVNNRFYSEDSLKERVELPIWWRRVSGNKYFFAYKQVVAEILPYFDLESIFFGEVHPLNQKSVVMFYWPEIYLLILGLLFLVREKGADFLKYLGVLIVIAGAGFVFSEGASYLRLVAVMWPMSAIMAVGLTRSYRWVRWIFIGLIGYGLLINSGDINRRSEYWLDNRPLAMQFWFKQLQTLDVNNLGKIQVTSRVGDPKKYCYFYLGKKCDEPKFVFEGFEISDQPVEPKTIWGGFAGEFVGSRFENDVANNWEKIMQDKGFTVVKAIELRDTIAYKYGNGIGLLIKE